MQHKSHNKPEKNKNKRKTKYTTATTSRKRMTEIP